VFLHILFLFCLNLFNAKNDFLSNNTLLEIGRIVIVAVVLLIVAIPEGLPLSISLAMALSINKLKEDEILIKNIQSV